MRSMVLAAASSASVIAGTLLTCVACRPRSLSFTVARRLSMARMTEPALAQSASFVALQPAQNGVDLGAVLVEIFLALSSVIA